MKFPIYRSHPVKSAALCAGSAELRA
ncbi:hypothetical protein A2U01_0091488, partial [Trifolium medium]|nr:hypothetical protein [Trifolium medium]